MPKGFAQTDWDLDSQMSELVGRLAAEIDFYCRTHRDETVIVVKIDNKSLADLMYIITERFEMADAKPYLPDFMENSEDFISSLTDHIESKYPLRMISRRKDHLFIMRQTIKFPIANGQV